MAAVRTSIPADVAACAAEMRQADQAEVGALGYTPLGALTDGLVYSRPCLTIVDRADRPLAMFGAVPRADLQGAANVWLLATDRFVRECRRQFLRECRTWVDCMNQTYPLLTNVVDARNAVHIRWLRWCGFEFADPIDVGGTPFIPFERRRAA